MKHRIHEGHGRSVLLLHGGPGAPGYLAPLARALAPRYRVIEAFERVADDRPLTVARHLDDLLGLMEALDASTPATIVGHSSGAMIALSLAARHPTRVRRLIAIGCGTFSETSRARLEGERERRIRSLGSSFDDDHPDPGEGDDARLARLGRRFARIDSHEVPDLDLPLLRCDARGHAETWADLLRLQREGIQPEEFAGINAPVHLLAGREDPHPAQAVYEDLAPFVRDLELCLFDRCGHYPWLERHARATFLEALDERLSR